MTVARQYILTASVGRSAALVAALNDLVALVRPIPGCEGIEILQDAAKPERLVFVEKWASIEAHERAARDLHKGAFASVMAALTEKPTASYLVYLSVT